MNNLSHENKEEKEGKMNLMIN